jgi:hypothetical protein
MDRLHVPESLHQLISEVAITKQKIASESGKVIEKLELFNEDFE